MNASRCTQQRQRGVLRWLSLITIGVLGLPAQAEFKVGAEIPGFSLKTSEGKSVEVRQMDGALTVQVDDERGLPKALIIHLLQPDCLQCRAQLQALCGWCVSRPATR